MAAAMDVARQFVRLAWDSEEPEPLTHMRLQKLLYYAQGWHLAAFGRPLFAAPIEAWPHGPVVREVYAQFKEWGRRPIVPQDAGEPNLDPRQKAFIEAVWSEYKGFSPSGLRKMTHDEAPWQEARRGLADDDASGGEIPQEAMHAFFAEQIQPRLIPGLSVEEAYQAIEQAQRGPGRPFKEVFADLRGEWH